MGKGKQISIAVVRRLPKYQRYLAELINSDVEKISSKDLSAKIGFTASQIRQDLSNFGDFGQQGYGYNVKELYGEICRILGLDMVYNTIIVGAGNIGQAIANYTNFETIGFRLRGMFDINPKLVGLKIRDIEIYDIDTLDGYLKDNSIDIGIICTPRKQAQKVADMIIYGGVRAIWNFAPVDLVLPEGVVAENVHLSESLSTLTYKMHEPELLCGIRKSDE